MLHPYFLLDLSALAAFGNHPATTATTGTERQLLTHAQAAQINYKLRLLGRDERWVEDRRSAPMFKPVERPSAQLVAAHVLALAAAAGDNTADNDAPGECPWSTYHLR